MNAQSEPQAATAPDPFYIVGIGASAGGLDALRTLISTLPAEPPFAIVVVVHLSPEHESHLVELLQSHTRIPVEQVNATVLLEPRHIYVIPPNANLDTIDTHLRLSQLETRRIERAPIDHFLRTLANTHGDKAIGVILTGAGSDGSLGLRLIKEQGGFTIAQEPEEAEYPSMPRSAIATGMVDVIARLRTIGREILRYCEAPPVVRSTSEGPDVCADSSILHEILQELRSRTGQEFSVFKPAILMRRIERRMRVRHLTSLHAYLELLRSRSEEAPALYHDLLVSVTEFFRDPEVFARLERDVFPQLFERKMTYHGGLRVWSVGCSSGEEAYSLAILMLEQAALRAVPPKLQLFATDLSNTALAHAREGFYPVEVAATVSPARLERFFVKELSRFRVRREVRDLVVFAAHNLFSDPPYSHMDLIVCRTLLRELQPDVRRGVVSLFYYALEPHGMLLVGSEDRVDDFDLFAPTGASTDLLRRVSGPRQPLQLPHGMQAFALPTLQNVEFGGVADPRRLARLHRKAVEKYLPPSVLINANNEIVDYSASAARYLHIPGGEPTHDVLRLISAPLRVALAEALQAVRRDSKPWNSGLFTLATGSGLRVLALRVDPVPAVESGLLLLLFDEKHLPERASDDTNLIAQAAGTMAQLQAALDEANLRLQHYAQGASAQDPSTVSAQEPTPAPEALQAVLEELENSREELQATNEELTTLDIENRRRIGELAQVSGDMQHLLESTGIATLFVDRQLRIVRFTPQLGELFNVRPADIGRPLADLTHKLNYQELDKDARGVLSDLAPADREVSSSSGRWYLSRMLPYRTATRGVEGVVLTLVDITDRKRIEERLREADRRKDEFLALLAHELRNPLAPLSAGIEILKASGSNPRLADKVIATLSRQIKQLTRLVDDLLDVSRITGGRLRLEFSVVDMSAVIADAVEAVRPIVEKARHQLTVNVAAEPLRVNGDAVRLAQVLANLLNNAAKFTPPAGRIEVTAERRGDLAVLTVKDNGRGIEPAAAARIFELFYQSDAVHRAHDAGLGIGLTMARTLAEMHGGTVTAHSPGKGAGSEFRLQLPLSIDQPAAQPSDSCDSRPPVGRRVLIVDDNPDAARMLGALVQMLGQNDVHMASGGREALQMAGELRPDVILLDLTMPDMDGFEVARRVRRETWGKTALLVALTGWGQEEHKRRTSEVGFNRHVTKPATIEDLREVLSAGPRARRESA